MLCYVFWQTCWGVWASLPYATPLWNFDSLSLVEDESLMLEVMLNCWMFDGETVAMGTLLWGEWLIPRIRLGLLFLIPSLISILLHKYFTWLNASKSFKVLLNLYFLSALIVWHTQEFLPSMFTSIEWKAPYATRRKMLWFNFQHTHSSSSHKDLFLICRPPVDKTVKGTPM